MKLKTELKTNKANKFKTLKTLKKKIHFGKTKPLGLFIMTIMITSGIGLVLTDTNIVYKVKADIGDPPIDPPIENGQLLKDEEIWYFSNPDDSVIVRSIGPDDSILTREETSENYQLFGYADYDGDGFGDYYYSSDENLWVVFYNDLKYKFENVFPGQYSDSGDTNNDGCDEIWLFTPNWGDDRNVNVKAYSGVSSYYTNTINCHSGHYYLANVATGCGDWDGDGKDNYFICYSKKQDHSMIIDQDLFLYIEDPDDGESLEITIKENVGDYSNNVWRWFIDATMGDYDGDGDDEVFILLDDRPSKNSPSDICVYVIDDDDYTNPEKLYLSQSTDTEYLDYEGEGFTSGDWNGDGKDEILYGLWDWEQEDTFWYLDTPSPEGFAYLKSWADMDADIVDMGDHGKDTFTVEYIGVEDVETYKHPVALLYKPPFINGINDGDGGYTDYSWTQSDGVAWSNTIGVTASLGFSVTAEIPMLVSATVGMEVESGMGQTYEQYKEKSVTTGAGTGPKCEPYVVTVQTLYRQFLYKILDNPYYEGQYFTIDIPISGPTPSSDTLSDYNDDVLDFITQNPDDVHPPLIPEDLHTTGYPTTYDKEPSEYVNPITDGSIGVGAGPLHSDIVLTEQESETLNIHSGCSLKSNLKVGPYALSASYGIYNDHSNTISVGHSTHFHGTVYGINGEIKDNYFYTWEMFVRRDDTDKFFIIDYYANCIGAEFDENNDIVLTSLCPVDLIVTNPNGDSISKSNSNIPNALYIEEDIDGDGELDDRVYIPDALQGDYEVSVIPESGADPTDTYSLIVNADGGFYYLEEDTQVSDIPDDPYIVPVGTTNRPPNQPKNPSPNNGASSVGTDITLSWTGGDPDGDPVTYDVYFGIDSTPDSSELVSNDQISTSYNPPGLLNDDTDFFWKIVSKDNQGHTVTGPTWSFSTGDQEPEPPSGILIVGNPKNGRYVTSDTDFSLPIVPGNYSYWFRTWYSGSWSSWQEYSTPFSLSGNCEHKIEYELRENGNTSDSSIVETFYVDNVAPDSLSIVGTPYYTYGGTEWITSDTPITLSATDLPTCGSSGVAGIYYNLDDGEGWHYENGYSVIVKISEQCPHNLQWYAKDNLGNTESTHSRILNVDNTPPTSSSSVGTPYYTDGANEWITSWTSIYLDATDGPPCGPCGVKEIHYNYGDGWATVSGNSATFTIPDECRHDLRWYAVDNLGNTESTHSRIIYVDNTPPTSDLTQFLYLGDPEVYPPLGQRQVDLDATDHPECPCCPCGVREIQYKVWSQATTSWSADWISATLDSQVGYPNAHAELIFNADVRLIKYRGVDFLGNTENEHLEQLVVLGFQQGWNTITIPIENSFIASTLADRIPGCEVLSRFDAIDRSFHSYIVGGPPGFDFPIENGYGHFVVVDKSDTITMHGTPLALSSISIPLPIQWNSIGWYPWWDTTASQLATSIAHCTLVSGFDPVEQTYYTYVVDGPPGFDFTITPGMGLFIYVDQTSVWNG